MEKARAFFKACAEIKPQLVILDVMLPDFDGLSVLEKLRKDKSTKKYSGYSCYRKVK
ncbi:MAG: hypothetical protein ACLVD9_09385 [Ruminococcus sp.]|uniref:hypothetical protein n=1 Tax=Ruminococcus sp. TaxID=41978 RepID=UPI0039995115